MEATLRQKAIDILRRTNGDTSHLFGVMCAEFLDLDEAAALTSSAWLELGAVELTPRERTILLMIAAGHDRKTIAKNLGIALQTVKNHTSNILEKMRAANAQQAVTMALKAGMEAANSLEPKAIAAALRDALAGKA